MPTQKPQNSKSKTRQNSYFIVPHPRHNVRSFHLFLGVMFGPEFAQMPKVLMVVPAARSLPVHEMSTSPIHSSVIRRSMSIL